jgi:hypothetical protein
MLHGLIRPLSYPQIFLSLRGVPKKILWIILWRFICRVLLPFQIKKNQLLCLNFFLDDDIMEVLWSNAKSWPKSIFVLIFLKKRYKQIRRGQMCWIWSIEIILEQSPFSIHNILCLHMVLSTRATILYMNNVDILLSVMSLSK